MADTPGVGPLTLLDIVKQNSGDIAIGLIDEASRPVPEMSGIDPWTGRAIPNMGAGYTIDGVNYEILVRTGLPTVSFRKANQGTDATRSQETLRMVEAFSMTPRWLLDRVVADRSKRSLQELMTEQADAHVTAALMHCGEQFYYGLDNDALGFTGLIAQYNSAEMTVDATGTGATTTSVWAVKFGAKYTQWVYGKNGKFDVSEIRQESVADDQTPAKYYTAYLQEMVAHIGLQVANKYSVARLKNVSASETNKTLDDDMLADLLEKFPAGYRPDVFLMTRRSHGQLRKSRTATNATGAPAPYPLEAHGVPIVTTDSIRNTETAA